MVQRRQNNVRFQQVWFDRISTDQLYAVHTDLSKKLPSDVVAEIMLRVPSVLRQLSVTYMRYYYIRRHQTNVGLRAVDCWCIHSLLPLSN